MRYFPIFIIIIFISCQSNPIPEVRVTVSEELTNDLKDGRLLLLFHHNDKAEPRFAVSDDINSAQVIGMDFEDYQSGQALSFNLNEFGYPIENYQNIPEGEYWVQAYIVKHEIFNRSDGHTIKMPMDQWEGRQWNRTPGNIYSKPQKIKWDGKTALDLIIDQVNPPVTEPEDTEFIKHVKFKSEMLSEFWGRDIYLGAHVLIPRDFDSNPNEYYPLMIYHGHFPSDFDGFRTTPPDEDLEEDYSARFNIYGYNKIQQQEAYDFYKKWISPDFQKFIVIEVQHANPFYDDSYAVNSQNIGPYGDAITYELIPHIEKQFRGIGEGWSRFVYGGSTGGWEALAVQVMYPNEYNGCFAACPDPIDFRAFTTVNIYEEENAYFLKGTFRTTDRVGKRDYLGHVSAMLKDMNHKELALGGTKSRSGDQWDIWQSVYSPVGEDGYPKPIWDRYSGKIDKEVAKHWQENFDLRYIMERDWSKLGKDLEGKIHIYCGDMDNYYLNNAVYLTEDFLESTTDPYYGGEVLYGDRAEHCWNGDPDLPNYITRLRYNTMYLDKIGKRLNATAPSNFNMKTWVLSK
ncbi:hypothetical protein [Aquiflexum lacus]|uniref:hypothetical protein n=1 Tax=Aquiflexum lacus TaxID=2483805 RepID=UPI00189481D3|nr:hypothetical protein [Aquiflexum lacus]